ncbi:hypothetical protein HK104_008115, partial [Borealophlyctis nickersoniae]
MEHFVDELTEEDSVSDTSEEEGMPHRQSVDSLVDESVVFEDAEDVIVDYEVFGTPSTPSSPTPTHESVQKESVCEVIQESQDSVSESGSSEYVDSVGYIEDASFEEAEDVDGEEDGGTVSRPTTTTTVCENVQQVDEEVPSVEFE